MALLVKNPPANTGDLRDEGSIPGSGRSPGGGNGNPLQYSCLENPMDRGAWWATVHGVTESQTRLSDLAQHHVTRWLNDDGDFWFLLCLTLGRALTQSLRAPSPHMTQCLRRAGITAILWVKTLQVLTLGSTVSPVSTCCPPGEKKNQPNFLHYATS